MSKRMTQKYWNSLSDDSRFRALRKVLSNFPDSINRDYSKQKANKLDDWVWKLIQRHVKQPDDSSFYKTLIDRTYLP